jgi:hypothetical protein
MSNLIDPKITRMIAEIDSQTNQKQLPTDTELGWKTANAVRRRQEWKYYKRPSVMEKAFINALK